MKKRVLAIAMSLAMTLSLLPVSALAAETGETPEEETQPASLTQETNGSEDQELTFDVEIDEDTQVTVGDSVENPVVIMDGKGYASLADAVAAVHELTDDARMQEHVIELQRNASGGGSGVGYANTTVNDDGTITTSGNNPVNITFDLNGLTYTVTNPTSGSSGTETNGFQLLQNSIVTFKDGTLSSELGNIIIQNYSDLTLDDVTVEASNASYVVSNNCGDINFTGNTSITAGTGKVAFDVCSYASYPGVTVNVDTTGTITGTIEISRSSGNNGEGKLLIKNGTFEGTISKSDSCAQVEITGGTFSSDVSKYIPSGMKQEGGEVVIDNEKAVASVNGVGYGDLQEAINAAGNSDTVKLLKETTSEKPITISEGQSFTLDLGRNVLTIQGTQEVRDVHAFGEDKVTKTAIVNNGTLTIANGTIITTADCNSITNTGTLEIRQDTVLSNSYETYSGHNLIVNLGGTVKTAGQLTSTANNGICTYGGNIAVTGGTISATHFQDWSNFASGITIFNRSYDNNSTGATVTISDGTIEAAIYAASTNNVHSGGNSPSNLTITGGTLTATKSTAIYWPSAGTLTIGTEDSVGGPTINSERGSAVEICSGTLNVYGGTLNGGTKMTEEDSYPTDQDLVNGYRRNSGSAGTGDAVTVISRRGSGYDTAPLTVNISGGTFNSPQNYGVRYMDCNLATTGTSEITQNVAVEIAGGNFDGGIAAVEAKFTEIKDKDFISGGSYSDSVSTYLTNKVNAELQRATGNTPFSYYKTVEDASADARPGDTVKPVNVEEGTTTTYTVTLKYNNGGADTTIIVVGNDSIKLPNASRTGYTFNGWRSSADNDLHKAGTSVTITKDTTFTADWTRNQTDRPSDSGSSSSDSGDYLITVDRVSGGRVTVQPGRADKGDTVTITVYPNDGYELDELVVTDSRGNEIDLDARSATRFTFTMPSGKVTVEASFVREGGQTQIPQTTFADVPASAWYYNAVEYVYENGLMSGVSGGRFAPDDTLTRAMLVQTLYAMEGRPAAASAGFADVASGDWYASAVNWAAANGVVSGVSETGFGPNNALTREQLALILYRFAQYKGYDVTGTSDLTAYADGSSVSGWAAEAMSWAVNAGLISGVGGNQIAPTGTATRAQVAQILMNFCENVAH